MRSAARHAPSLGRCKLLLVAHLTTQPLAERADEAAGMLFLWDGRLICLPLLWEEKVGASTCGVKQMGSRDQHVSTDASAQDTTRSNVPRTLVEKVQLLLTQKEDAPQHELRHALWVCDGIRQG